VVNTPASYWGGPRWKPWLGEQLSWLKYFVVFLSSFRWMLGQYLKIRSWPLPSKNTYHFIFHLSPFMLHYIVCVSEKASKFYMQYELLHNLVGNTILPFFFC
jgi:hypothetical protein